MKIKFIATAQAPDSYSFSVENITVHFEGQSEDFDFSLLAEGDQFEGAEPTILPINGSQIIRDAYRDINGLHVTLCQRSGDQGDWIESDWIESADYNSETQYIQEA